MMFRWPMVVFLVGIAIVVVSDILGFFSVPASTDITSDACVGAGVLAVLYSITGGRMKSGTPRRENAICRTCGYDLRATPERCPECGNEPDQPDDIAGSVRCGSPH